MKIGPLNFSLSENAPVSKVRNFYHSVVKRITEEKSETPVSRNDKDGVAPPYSLPTLEGAYLLDTNIKGAVDITVNACTQSGYKITLVPEDDPRAEEAHEFLENWLDTVNFNLWRSGNYRNALIYGSSFTEPTWENVAGSDGKTAYTITRLKLVDPKTMRIRWDNHARVTGFVQDAGNNKKIEFNPSEIEHFPLDTMPGTPWGTSVIRPLMGNKAVSLFQQKQNAIRYVGLLLERKALAPLHVQMGSAEKDISPTEEDIESFVSDLQNQDENTQYVTGPYVKMDILGFGGKEVDLGRYLKLYDEQYTYGLQVPQVLMGMGSVPEGLAISQFGTFMLRIKALHAQEETFIESNLLNVLLAKNGFTLKANFQALTPSEADKTSQVSFLQTLLSPGVMIQPLTRTAIENKLRGLLEIEGEVEPPEPMQPATTPSTGGSPYPDQSSPPAEEPVDEVKKNGFYSLSEVVTESFDVMSTVLGFIAGHSFNDVTDISPTGIDVLRSILSQGIEDRKSIASIASEIADKVTNGDQARALAIARTEVVRAENEGALSLFRNSTQIEKVQFLAAADERVDDVCASYDGQEFNFSSAQGLIPVHPNCRCTWLPVLTESYKAKVIESDDCDANGGSWATINGAHVCMGSDYSSAGGFLNGYKQVNKLPNGEIDRMLKTIVAKTSASKLDQSFKDKIGSIAMKGINAGSHADKVIAVDSLAQGFHAAPGPAAKLLTGMDEVGLQQALNDLRNKRESRAST